MYVRNNDYHFNNSAKPSAVLNNKYKRTCVYTKQTFTGLISIMNHQITLLCVPAVPLPAETLVIRIDSARANHVQLEFLQEIGDGRTSLHFQLTTANCYC